MKKFESKIFSRGSIAVECALIMPIFLLLFSAVLFLGKIFWHYTVLEKAAQDSAAFLARVSIEDIRSANTGGENPIATATRQIALAEVAELLPGDSMASVNVLCDDLYCDGGSTPTAITVVIRATMVDPLWSSILLDYGLGGDILLTATASTDFLEKAPGS
jgi:Flp pilus assembly protein TadG